MFFFFKKRNLERILGSKFKETFQDREYINNNYLKGSSIEFKVFLS